MSNNHSSLWSVSVAVVIALVTTMLRCRRYCASHLLSFPRESSRRSWGIEVLGYWKMYICWMQMIRTINAITHYARANNTLRSFQSPMSILTLNDLVDLGVWWTRWNIPPDRCRIYRPAAELPRMYDRKQLVRQVCRDAKYISSLFLVARRSWLLSCRDFFASECLVLSIRTVAQVLALGAELMCNYYDHFRIMYYHTARRIAMDM
jgi:hypothetical protein